MTRIDLLKKNYQRLCRMPWDRNVAGPQRVWIAVYDEDDERKLRLRLRQFEEVTLDAGHKWTAIDLTDAFAAWMSGPENAAYADSYFESPELLDEAVLAGFKRSVVSGIRSILAGLTDPDNTVLTLHGVGCLFGFLKVSEILPAVEEDVKGRRLVFFPGRYEQNNYRLLDARDGWNYHAIPILASDGEPRS
jgi:hypothetical protein